MTLHFTHNAMATQFELWMVGNDAGFLQAIAFEVWTELDRLELMLSRFDPRAEVARINREASERPVRVEIELFNILQDCHRWYINTRGYFDVCMRSNRNGGPDQVPGKSTVRGSALELDENKRTVYLNREDIGLDLGGYGKGYALDTVAQIIKGYGNSSAFIQGGTSSVLSWGQKEDETPWRVDIPHYNDRKTVLTQKPLYNQGFSYSAVFHSKEDASDILNPHMGETVTEPAACWVIAPTALQAEVFTTAMLAMGKERAQQFILTLYENSTEACWI